MVVLLGTRTPDERLAMQEDRGRNYSGQLAGSFLDDLAALGKCLWLCPSCIPKFNAKQYRYTARKKVDGTYFIVRCNCDGCKHRTDRALMFVPQHYHIE
jgi:hypothetical protein